MEYNGLELGELAEFKFVQFSWQPGNSRKNLIYPNQVFFSGKENLA